MTVRGCGYRIRGRDNPNWQGGRSLTSGGYVRVRASDHPAAVDGYILEHRLVVETHLGRVLRPDEQVHHRNGVKTDNRPENLEVVSAGLHRVRHRKHEYGRRIPGEPNPMVGCECGCGKQFLRFDPSGAPRRFVHNHHGRKPRS